MPVYGVARRAYAAAALMLYAVCPPARLAPVLNYACAYVPAGRCSLPVLRRPSVTAARGEAYHVAHVLWHAQRCPADVTGSSVASRHAALQGSRFGVQ